MGNKAPQLTPKEMARENKKTVDRASRKIDRERTKIQNNEKKLLAEIKGLAKKNQHNAAKILTKDLIRNKN